MKSEMLLRHNTIDSISMNNNQAKEELEELELDSTYSNLSFPKEAKQSICGKDFLTKCKNKAERRKRKWLKKLKTLKTQVKNSLSIEIDHTKAEVAMYLSFALFFAATIQLPELFDCPEKVGICVGFGSIFVQLSIVYSISSMRYFRTLT
jgi:hypothetical protein